MRIVLFNVKYSANLGDGLLTECLEAELRRCSSNTSVTSIDLAGRRHYAQGGRYRRAALTVLQMLPAAARQFTAGLIVDRKVAGMKKAWGQELATADAVVIGGGNLFSDADLNFPIKIYGAIGQVTAKSLPVGVFGVGVADNWSARGKHLFLTALAGARLVHVAVRDARSQSIWKREFAGSGIRDASRCSTLR